MSQIARQSQSYQTLITEAAQYELADVDLDTKKKIWIKAAEQLYVECSSIDGQEVGKEKIAAMLRADIEKAMQEQAGKGFTEDDIVFESGWFRRVMREHGYTDKKYTRNEYKQNETNVADQPHSDASYIENMDHPEIYVNETANRDSEGNEKPHANYHLLYIIGRSIEDLRFCYRAVKGMNDKSIFEEMGTDGKLFKKELSTIVRILKDSIDEKNKVPMDSVHIYHKIRETELSLIKIGRALATRRAHLLGLIDKWMTAKQAKRHNMNAIRRTQDYYIPGNDEDARFIGFYGTQCSDCQGYRMELNGSSDLVVCIDCGNSQVPERGYQCRFCQEPLYREDYQILKKTKECRHCGNSLVVPQSLLKRMGI